MKTLVPDWMFLLITGMLTALWMIERWRKRNLL